MNDFAVVPGFEDVWRPPVRTRPRTPETVLGRGDASDVRARLIRIVERRPEVMVKVTGRTRDGDHLRAHLDYISRRGAIEMDGPDGAVVAGRAEIRELADDWTALAVSDSRKRVGSPLSLSVVLSMPEGTDVIAIRGAGRAFADEVFGAKFDYVLALHTDTGRPHVHIAACSRGYDGGRLNPKKADLDHWRQVFAQALRDRGVEAEATPRRARGVTRKAERGPLRRMRERHAKGLGQLADVRRAAYHDATKAAFGGEAGRRPWEARLLERQNRIRGLYLAQVDLLAQSINRTDRELAVRVAVFVHSMPSPDSQRLALARELSAANRRLGSERDSDGKDRSR